MTLINTKTPIFCLSSQDWDDNLWTNKQHLMLRLSRKGNPVLYVCRKSQPFLTFLLQKPATHQPLFNGKGVTPLSDTLSLFQSPEIPLSGLLKSSLNYDRFGRKLARLCEHIIHARNTTGEIPIIWVYDPGYGHYLDLLPKPYFLIYDCVDDYASFPVNANDRYQHHWIQASEKKVLAAADLVTTTAQKLFDDKRQYNANTHYVHNVGDFDHFNRVMTTVFSEPLPMQAIPHPRIGFFGAVSSYKLDIPLLENLALKNPHFHYCLLGPLDRHEKNSYSTLESLPNVHFLGKIAYEDLPSYIQYLDVLMIPYAINTHTSHVFPIKFFEYLATGKPVVVTPLPAYDAYVTHVERASDAESFFKKIEALLSTPDTQQSARLALAKQHDWESRLSKILTLISQSKMY